MVNAYIQAMYFTIMKRFIIINAGAFNMLINNDTIIKDDNPLIREKSQEVELPLSAENEQILRDMFKYVEDSTNEELAKKENLRAAVGISAIQIGIPRKLTAVIVPDVDKDGNDIRWEFMLANPKITSSSIQKAFLTGGEGCLSVVEDHPGFVYRSARITFEAYDLVRKQNIRVRARGYLAIVLQHEFEHFDGTLFYDHIDPKNPYHKIPGAIEI